MIQEREQSLCMIGCNHKNAPLQVRELFSLTPENVDKLYSTLLNDPNVFEVLILNTCNRVEIYAVTHSINYTNHILTTYCSIQGLSNNRPLSKLCILSSGKEKIFEGPQCTKGVHEDPDEIFDIARGQKTEFRKRSNVIDPYFSVIEGQNVIEHLFKVASGIDSQLVGETEILGQVKNAYAKASSLGATGKILNKVLQKTFQVAKWSRSNTGIGKGQISIGSVTADLALRIFGDLASTKILIIGSGEAGEKTLHALKLRGANNLTVTNRTFERACELSEKISGTAIRYEHFPKMINLFDIVICSTGASEIILCSDITQKAMIQRPEMPLFLIDLSMPRNICHKTTEITNTFLYNLDDLSHIANENLKARQSEIQICTNILSQKANTIWQSITKNHKKVQIPQTPLQEDTIPTGFTN